MPCSTIIRQGSGTREMLPWEESAQGGPAGPPAPPPSAPGGPVVDPIIGMSIGSFRVVKMIGKGGMGTVYLGEQTVIGSKVAIKILHDHLASNASLVSRFYAEARAVNLIGHENIVNIFDMNVVPPNRYYLIMELLEGRPLNLLARGPVAPEIVVPILTQVCDALEAAHSHGVVHRDLKPENIFLIKRGRNENFAKILDFGIARLFASEASTEQTAAGMIVGTPEYMAPEQCTGEKIDGRADLYALGVIAYLLTTGKLPFTGGGLTGLLLAHQSKIATPPHQVNPSIPLELSAVIMRSLAKRPDDRFQTAGELASALEFAVPPTAMGGRAPMGGVPPPPLSSPRPSTPDPRQPGPPAQGAPAAWTEGGTPPASYGAPLQGGVVASAAGAWGTPPVGAQAAFIPPAPLASPEPQAPGRDDMPTPPLGASAANPWVPAPAPPPPVAAAPARAATRETPIVRPPDATPMPVHARHTATFDARVTTLDGTSLGALKCQDISKGGCFLCTDGKVPALFVRVKVAFPVAGDLECAGEVVRHVTKDQAAAWGMSPGFGVQFATLTTEQKDALGRVVQGLPAHKAALPPKSDRDDPVAEQALVQYRKRINGDHYVVLALMQDAELSEVRARGREARRMLEALRARPLSVEQKAQLETALTKVQAAVDTLGTALTRLTYDAQRANFKGVARCIAAGLTVTEIDVVRATYLSSHAGAEAKGHVKFISGNAYETNNQPPRAIEQYEEALALDPLNLRYQQRYWALKRRSQTQ